MEETTKIVRMTDESPDGARLRKLLRDLVSKSIAPHAEMVARWHGYGALIGVVHDIDPANADAARAWGWDGSCSVFRLSKGKERVLAGTDGCAQRWVAAPRDRLIRYFVLIQGGTLLVNFDTDAGEYFLEPGQSDLNRN
jgi:hypothetical protein